MVARAMLALRRQTLGLEMGQVKLVVVASSKGQAESQGSMAVWALLAMGVAEHIASEPITGGGVRYQLGGGGSAPGGTRMALARSEGQLGKCEVMWAQH
ncbi:hypothetical protein MHYP_G00048810 [Metynnis hypsauchen]